MKKAQNGVFRCFGCEPTEKIVYHYASWINKLNLWKFIYNEIIFSVWTKED